MSQELPYEIHVGITGKSILYACPQCKTELSSKLSEAGKQDVCPACRAKFMVPGQSYCLKKEEEKQKLEQEKVRRLAKIQEQEKKIAEQDASDIRQAREEYEEELRILDEQYRKKRQAERLREKNNPSSYYWLKVTGNIQLVLGAIIAMAGIILGLIALGKVENSPSQSFVLGVTGVTAIVIGIAQAGIGEALLAVREITFNTREMNNRE